MLKGETRFEIQNCIEVNQESVEADCIDPNQINLTELREIEHEYSNHRKEEQ